MYCNYSHKETVIVQSPDIYTVYITSNVVVSVVVVGFGGVQRCCVKSIHATCYVDLYPIFYVYFMYLL